MTPARPSAKSHASAEAPSRRIVTAEDLGRAIQRRRADLGHTQAEAAALCNVGVRFLSELERGKPTAEIGKALKVARRLGLELALEARGDSARQPGEGP